MTAEIVYWQLINIQIMEIIIRLLVSSIQINRIINLEIYIYSVATERLNDIKQK